MTCWLKNIHQIWIAKLNNKVLDCWNCFSWNQIINHEIITFAKDVRRPMCSSLGLWEKNAWPSARIVGIWTSSHSPAIPSKYGSPCWVWPFCWFCLRFFGLGFQKATATGCTEAVLKNTHVNRSCAGCWTHAGKLSEELQGNTIKIFTFDPCRPSVGWVGFLAQR